MALALAVVASAALAQERKEDWPEGSAMHTAFHYREKRDASEGLLTKRQAELLALLAERKETEDGLAEALKAQHQGWLKFRTEDCTLAGALTGGGGAWPTAHAFECEVGLTERRQRAVATALRCLKAMPAAKRETDSARCLQPLVSLTRGRSRRQQSMGLRPGRRRRDRGGVRWRRVAVP